MSTTYGVNIKGVDIELKDDELPTEYYEREEEDFVKVLFRGNNGGIFWTNELAKFLPDNLKIYPLDNSAQGIYTIGDAKKEIENQK
jgi:hypothetical protein